jgi:hypothetical protein
MGQFTARPEEPAEWAGLPSEPLRARPAAESLDDPIESADTIALFSGATASVVIPLGGAEIAGAGSDADPQADRRSTGDEATTAE